MLTYYNYIHNDMLKTASRVREIFPMRCWGTSAANLPYSVFHSFRFTIEKVCLLYISALLMYYFFTLDQLI